MTGMLLVVVLLAGTNAFAVVRGKGVGLVKEIGFYAGICYWLCYPAKLKTEGYLICCPPAAYPDS
jgi:hypothetical protein